MHKKWRVGSGVQELAPVDSPEPVVDFQIFCELIVKIIALKIKAINTKKSSSPNYFTIFYYYLCLRFFPSEIQYDTVSLGILLIA